MDWLNELNAQFERNVPLSDKTSFGLGGSAQYVVSPKSETQLADLVRRSETLGLPWRVLGGGANVLINDNGVDGVVVRLDDDTFRSVRTEGDLLIAGGGVDLVRLVKESINAGLTGLEFLAGIPGTVGGAVCMNAGGRFGQISDCVQSVRVIQPDGTHHTYKRDDIAFGYRTSGLKGVIVTEVVFALQRDLPESVRQRYQEYLAYKTNTQPAGVSSAGCIFKNPPGDSAGRLIDSAGLKGTRVGAAEISDAHANFIIAREGATAQDVIELVRLIQQVVREMHGIELELEIDIWNDE